MSIPQKNLKNGGGDDNISYMERIAIVGAHGIGDCLLSLQCASLIRENPKYEVASFICARPEVEKPLQFMFPSYNIINLGEQWGENNKIIEELNKPKNEWQVEYLANFDTVYYVIPDLLFSNKHAFNYKRFNLTPRVIKEQRLLYKQWRPKNIIYCALNTTTQGYQYIWIEKLLEVLGRTFPDYGIYYPHITNWANQNTKNKFDFSDNLPPNIIIEKDPDITEAISLLCQSEYCICLDNGFMHIAQHLGMPKLLLDARIGVEHAAWAARWRYNMDESINLYTKPETIARVIYQNINNPYTQLIDQEYISDCEKVNWRQHLFVKDL